VLGSGRTLTAITHQRVAYILKAALQIVALGLLATVIPVTFFLKTNICLVIPERVTHSY